MTANNEIGRIEPIAEIAALVHEHGTLFHTDAVQAVGHIPLNVKAMNIDFLSASSHKFYGPKGIGFLCCKKDIMLSPYQDGGAQERGRRAGTENVPAIAAMALALEKSCAEMKIQAKRLRGLESRLLEDVSNAGIDFQRNGAENYLPGNVSLSFYGADGEMLLHRLDFKHICVSTGSACNSKAIEISHVLQAIGFHDDYARGTIRVTFGRENNESDSHDIANALIDILTKK